MNIIREIGEAGRRAPPWSVERRESRTSRGPGEEWLHPFRTCLRRVDLLGKGSQGVVFLCRDLRKPQTRVAAKVARTRSSRASLPDEVRALWALRGAEGVPTLKGLLYHKEELHGFVTHYRDGETLARLVLKDRIGPRDVLPLALSIGEAVVAVAKKGYIHRDIKPENILCTPDWEVQILDFGLACRISEAPRNGEISGTLAYASPEQIEGKRLDSRSDLFSLGAVLYEITTGRMFFSPESVGLGAFLELRERRLREPVKLEGVDPDLATLIRRLLVKEPLLRADVRETAGRLRELRARCPRSREYTHAS